jgi:hypothetical protein
MLLVNYDKIAQNILMRWGDAVGDMAFGPAEEFEKYGKLTMHMDFDNKYIYLLKKYKKEGVRDYHGRLADDLHSDPYEIRSWMPDQIWDAISSLDRRGSFAGKEQHVKRVAQELANTGHSGVKEAMDDFLGTKKLKKEKKYPTPKAPKKKIPKPLPPVPSPLAGSMLSADSKIARKIKGKDRMKAADGSTYVKMGRQWYQLKEGLKPNSFDTLYESKVGEFISLSETKEILNEAKEDKYKKLIVQDNHGYEYYPVVTHGAKAYSKAKGTYTAIHFNSADGKNANIPKWALKGILYGDKWGAAKGNELYIDMGQNWYLTGLNKVWDFLRKKYPETTLMEDLNEDRTLPAKALKPGMTILTDPNNRDLTVKLKNVKKKGSKIELSGPQGFEWFGHFYLKSHDANEKFVVINEAANKKLIGKTVKVTDPDNDLKGWTFQHGDKVKVLKYKGEQGPYGAEYEVTDGKSTALLTGNYLGEDYE